MDNSFAEAAQAIAAPLGAVNPVALGILASWSFCEKPHGPGGAWQWNNPLNTCWQTNGSWPAGPACVQAFPTRAEGVYATLRTLLEGRYPTLVAGLRQGSADLFFSAGGEMATWGTSLACVRSIYGYVPAPAPPPTPAPAGVGTKGLAVVLAVAGVALLAYGRPPRD